MKDFIMKPKIDFAFKEIMADEKARTGFLSAVLRMPPEEIRETVLLDTHLKRKHKDDKLGILDVRLRLCDGTEIDIEIQLRKLSLWPERSLFYICKMYTDKAKPGEGYDRFKKCVSISILDFKLFEDSEDFYSCFHIAEDKRHTFLTDKMEFHVIELPKLSKALEDCSDDSGASKASHGDFFHEKLKLWARFINAEKKEEFEMIAQKDKYIGSAYRRLQAVSRDRKKRLEYESRLKAELDHNQFLSDARQEGMQEGLQEGLRKGKREGLQEGEQKGEQKLALLLTRLTADERTEDIQRVLTDSTLRKKLYMEYGIK